MHKFEVVLIDDSKSMLMLEKVYLKDMADEVHTFLNPLDGIEFIKNRSVDLVVVDYMMPEMDGLDVVKNIHEIDDDIKIIMVTSVDDNELKLKALENGAIDFLSKPLSEAEFKTRVRNIKKIIVQQKFLKNKTLLLKHEIDKHLKEITLREEEALSALANVSEYRDEGTFLHVVRVAKVSKILAKYYGLSEEEQEIVFKASPLHDIGKIAIRDNILLKNGKLTDEEFEEMKKHTICGYDILRNSVSRFLKAGAVIALSHHERWDGKGYPYGYKGKDIHIFSRIVSIVDVFDALCSDRPYKKAWKFEDALQLIKDSSEKNFDPELVEIFTSISDEIFDFYRRIGKASKDELAKIEFRC